MTQKFDLIQTALSEHIGSLIAENSLNDALADVAKYIEANSAGSVFVSL